MIDLQLSLRQESLPLSLYARTMVQIIAAHICYLVAEANFESYSDSARLCLVGADHWKCPRTYASPGSIQVLPSHLAVSFLLLFHFSMP